MKTKQPAELIEQLVAEGGAIVTSGECSHIEIADAQATGRWAVNEEGIGFVRRYPEWLARHKTCQQKAQESPNDGTQVRAGEGASPAERSSK